MAPELVYDHGGIQLWCGDCRDVLPGLADASVDLVLTDPPYNVGMRYGDTYTDDRADYADFVLGCFNECRRIGKVVMLTTGMRNVWIYPPPTWVMCWAKPGSTRRSALGGFNDWEPVLVYGYRRIYNDFRYLPTAPNLAGSDINHPCPKPLALCSWLITEGCDIGDLVLDPFAGSGTTLLAAKRLGRRAIGIELSPEYCEIAIRRLAQEVMPLEEPKPAAVQSRMLEDE